MAERINIMADWKEFNPHAEKSMKDDFGITPSPFQEKILNYLKNGEVIMAAPSRAIDVFSDESINQTNSILTDGEYSWSGSLSYYVQTYNLKLPAEFENKILNLC